MTMPTFEPESAGNPLTQKECFAAGYEAGKRDAVPEGFTLVPNDPEGQWSNPDLINIMVDAFNDAEGGKYDSMLAAYKAMLAAAPKGEKE